MLQKWLKIVRIRSHFQPCFTDSTWIHLIERNPQWNHPSHIFLRFVSSCSQRSSLHTPPNSVISRLLIFTLIKTGKVLHQSYPTTIIWVLCTTILVCVPGYYSPSKSEWDGIPCPRGTYKHYYGLAWNGCILCPEGFPAQTSRDDCSKSLLKYKMMITQNETKKWKENEITKWGEPTPPKKWKKNSISRKFSAVLLSIRIKN